MPESCHQLSARRQMLLHASISFPVIFRERLLRLNAWRTSRCRLVVCGLGAVLLFGMVNVANAQTPVAQVASASTSPDRIPRFIEAASRQFAMPASWIRAVMQVESGGEVRAVSPKGAMGLMQIMPDTWAELRSRHGLGADPYEPRDNIMAGTAYLRELHDRFGDRGFIAAYNAGPGRYEEHVSTGRPLPPETLAYTAAVNSLLGIAVADGPAATPPWASGSLFVGLKKAHTGPPQRSSSQPSQHRSVNAIVQEMTALTPVSTGLFVSTTLKTWRP